MRRFQHVVMSLLTFACACGSARTDTVNWPQFRGPHSDGLAEGATVPDRWSTTENVVWKIDVPGWGWSSPVIWGDKIFLTSAVVDPPLPTPKVGGYPGGNVKAKDVHRFVLYCIDRETGKLLWEREVHKGVPPQPRHPRNSYASETPITDGQRVYAYFGNLGLFVFDMDGKPLWDVKWPAARMRGGWGTGASPVLHKDRLYLVNDNEEKSFLVALDARTGKQIWRVQRDEKSNWATPYIWENDQRTELVTIGKAKARSYDLAGNVLWQLEGTSGLVSLMPVAKHGLLYLGAGYHYGPLYAIRPGASGDISLKEGEQNEWVAWHEPKGAGIHPSFLITGGRLYSLFDAGFLTCHDAKTGKVLYNRQRLFSEPGRFYASPWSCNGKVFMLNEDGKTYVIDDGPTYKLLHTCDLAEPAWATPAIAQGSLFLRTYSKLYRIEAAKRQGSSAEGSSAEGSSAVRADPPKHAVEGRWSEAAEGVRVRLISKKAAYAPGESIALVFELRNESDEKLHLPTPDFLPVIWYAGDHPYERGVYPWAVNLQTPGKKTSIFWARRASLQQARDLTLLPAGAIHRVEIEAGPQLSDEADKPRRPNEPQRESLQWVPGKDAGAFVLEVRYQAAKAQTLAGRFGKVRELRTPKIEIRVGE
jgi:outer membrane protein assembly factor BamB